MIFNVDIGFNTDFKVTFNINFSIELNIDHNIVCRTGFILI